MTNTFRGQTSLLKSTVTIASSIQCFKHHPRRRVDKTHCDWSANVFEVAPDRACSNRFVLYRRYPASHAEISESTNQMQIPQQHAHLQRTLVFEPTSCTNRQCVTLDRFVVHLKLAHWNQNREEKTLHGRVAPVQDSSVLTFVWRPCSSHDRERSTFSATEKS